ncbi:MAG: hypothetical protein LC437_08605 [Thiohalomonas sp.]|nr:hypothetical protein [Thiohalomonas sp.]
MIISKCSILHFQVDWVYNKQEILQEIENLSITWHGFLIDIIDIAFYKIA